MKCGQLLSQDLRKGQPRNTAEDLDPEQHHSVLNLTGGDLTARNTQQGDAVNDDREISTDSQDTGQPTDEVLNANNELCRRIVVYCCV